MLTPWEKGYDRPRQRIKKQKHCFINKGLYSQSYGFSTHCVWMWELGHKAGWAWKKWCFGTVVLEKTLESPLGFKEFKPANPKENQPWVFTGRTGAEASIFPLPPDAKSRLIGKDPDTEKDWRQEEKGTTEDEMVTYCPWLNQHEFEQTLGDSDRRGAWNAIVHGISKSQTQLSDWTATNTLYYIDIYHEL